MLLLGLKALSVVAWPLRFINNCKERSNKCNGPLTHDELTNAKIKLFSCVQRETYFKEIEALSQGGPFFSKFFKET